MTRYPNGKAGKFKKKYQINLLLKVKTIIKVSGPYVKTSCVFFCIKNIINAEMWA